MFSSRKYRNQKTPDTRSNDRITHTRTLALGLFTSLSALQLEALAYSEQGVIGDAKSWRSNEFNMNWGLEAIGADHAYARGLSGNGIRLGIFDSGSDLRHDEFDGKDHRPVRLADLGCERETLSTETAKGCFYSEGDRSQIKLQELPEQALDTIQDLLASGELSQEELTDYINNLGAHYQWHGTFVAGIMLANRDGKGTHGVAYGANLNPLRIFNNTYNSAPPSLASTQASGFPEQHAIASAYEELSAQNVRAINQSWGFSSSQFQTMQELDNRLAIDGPGLSSTFGKGSKDYGFIQVFSAGNVPFPQPEGAAAPIAGVLPSLPRATPELEPFWLSVVNVNQNLTLDPSSFRCGFSMNWCVAAPGTDITSSQVTATIDVEKLYDEDGEVNGFNVIADRPLFGYTSATGTSASAPQVTGALGLLMERFPYLDNPQIRDVLLTTARDIGAPGIDDVYGWGLIDLKKAIDGPGQIRVDTHVVMDRMTGGAKVWQGDAWDDWRNDIGGPGRLGFSGPGWLRLSGNNSFAGATLDSGTLELDGVNRLTRDIQVNGGLLRLNGSLQDTDLNLNRGTALISGQQNGGHTRVGAGALLIGDGALSSTRVEGTIIPGSEMHALTVNGAYQQVAGSTLIAHTPRNNTSQPALKATGLASIEGGTLRLTRDTDGAVLGQQYSIVQADGGVTGQFSTLDHQQFSPFLGFNQRLDTNNLFVEVGRGLPLTSVATTPNQRATANAADNLALSQPLAQKLTALFPSQAPHALDQLSGELHASTQGVMIENTRVIRDAALGRTRSTQLTVAQQAGESRQSVWVQLPYQNGRLSDDNTTSPVSHSNTGLLMGVDHVFEQGTQAGIILGSSRGNVKAGARGKANIDTYQIGLHVGHNWDAFGLYGGVSYANNQIQSKRQVNFPGVSESLSAKYTNRTGQLFIESNYRFEQGALEWQPYVQLAHIRSSNGSFSERGGSSALKGKNSTNSANLASAGLRFKLDMAKTETGPSWLSFNGGMAYTHASGNLQPTTQVALAGANSMSINGAPLNRNTLRTEFGTTAQLTRDSALSVTLNDQRGDRSRERGVTAQYQFNF